MFNNNKPNNNPSGIYNITSLVSETNGVVTFKQQEETNEEVYGYVAIHNNKIISGIYTHYHRIDEDYPNSNIYEIFKSKK